MCKSSSKLLFLVVIILGIFPLSVFAATFYAAPTGSGTTCSSTSPCTIGGGLSKMASGDTLILKDGTYTGAANMMSEYAPNLYLPPSGAAGNYTKVWAEHVGQAIIDGQYNYPVVSNSNVDSRARSYVHFDGIHFKRGLGSVFVWMGSYNKITNCGFEDGIPASNTDEHALASIQSSSGYASTYNLVEDCWVWGRGRYGFYFSGGGDSGLGTNHNIMRRMVVRQDSVPPWVSAGIRFYKGQYNTCQNCIVIDGRMDGASEASAFTMGGGSSYGEELNHIWKGVIALNNSPNVRGYWTEDINTLAILSNSIIWGQNGHGLSATSSSGSGTLSLSNMTIGANAGTQVNNNGQLVWNLTNSIVSVPANQTAFASVNSLSNTSYYLASGATAGQSGGTSITLATLNAGLKYLPRIEAGSTLGSAGAGANILYQEGVSGTYYGQSGWDTTTTTPLWPFANESVWAAKMKAYTASGPGGNRGFAAVNSTTPLTDYIWGYLGNPKPDIYGTGVTDTTPPTASITAPVNNATVSGTVAVNANASDNIGVTKVEFYVNGTLETTVTASPYSFNWDTTVESNNTYTLIAKAYDTDGNVGQSSAIIVNVNNQPAADTVLPTISLLSPVNNASVSSTVTITATAADNLGVNRVDFYVKGGLRFSSNVSPYKFNWDTTADANGSYALAGKAYDAAGNVGQSSVVTVTVNNPVPDTTLPTVAISSPASASTIIGTVTVSATAADNVGVSRVEFYVNGILQSSDNSSPYSFNWNTASVANGNYNLTAKAYDAAGNVGQSSAVSVTVNNSVADTIAPTVAISSPLNNSIFSGTVASVVVSATDNVGISKVEFYVNGILQGTDTSSPYTFSWNTATLANGSYALTAKAYDAAGNAGQSSAITVTVNNLAADTTAPTVAITAPTNSAPTSSVVISGTVSVSVSATDNVGVSKVEFYVNGILQNTDTASPYTFSWNTATLVNGSYSLTAKAYDAAGNVGQSSAVSVTVNNPVKTIYTIWPDTAKPLVDADPDTSAIEVGMKFKSDVKGYITGLRFYKSSSNIGKHVASLWTKGGVLLRRATFTSETASGWQQVNFTTPLAIAANTVYVASYHANAGHYSDDENFFTGKGVDNGPLHALADGISGYSGVYKNSSTSSFPTKGWNGSNYWVDVVFKY